MQQKPLTCSCDTWPVHRPCSNACSTPRWCTLNSAWTSILSPYCSDIDASRLSSCAPSISATSLTKLRPRIHASHGCSCKNNLPAFRKVSNILWTALSPDRPCPGLPNISLFLLLSWPIFAFFLPELALWEGRGLEPGPQFHEKTPPERKKKKIVAQKKTAKFWAPTFRAPHSSGPHPAGPHPSAGPSWRPSGNTPETPWRHPGKGNKREWKSSKGGGGWKLGLEWGLKGAGSNDIREERVKGNIIETLFSWWMSRVLPGEPVVLINSDMWWIKISVTISVCYYSELTTVLETTFLLNDVFWVRPWWSIGKAWNRNVTLNQYLCSN